MLHRRDFLKVIALAALARQADAKDLLKEGTRPTREALHYQKLGNGLVGCRLCPRQCTIAPENSGFCRSRRNSDGTLFALSYAAPCAIHIDPIEKKPFFNFLPKSRSFSIASAGCNLRCKFCQNWEISQVSPLETINHHAPSDAIALEAIQKRCESVAYTYTEPSTFFEYMLDTARACRARGLLNVYHSNGFINPGPLKELCAWLDAANIDLKGFTPAFYRDICEAELEPVLETLKGLKRHGVWLEITNLVIPGHNDDIPTIRRMAQWVKANLGAETPLHFSRFFPLYKLTGVPPTPVPTLEQARAAALETGLHYVYIGNVPGHAGAHTHCPKCGKSVVKRTGFTVLELNVKDGRCAFCRAKLAGRWKV